MLRWLFGKGVLYLWLVAATAFLTLALPPLKDAWGHRDLAWMSPAQVQAQFRRDRDAARAAWTATRQDVSTQTADQLRARLAERRQTRAGLESRLFRSDGLFAQFDPAQVLARKRLELQARALDAEIALIEAALEPHRLRGLQQAALAQARRSLDAPRAACRDAIAKVQAFRRTLPLEQAARNLVFQEEARLREAGARRCKTYDDLARAQQTAVHALQTQIDRAQTAADTAARRGDAAIAAVRLDGGKTFRSILIGAAVALLGIVVTPPLIRLVFFFGLAPLAERRPAIRLNAPAGAPPTLAQPSGPSVAITLRPGEELLVRQGFLQSTSTHGPKGTRALLDWRHPLSSLASGLSFLTCIAGEGETTTVSAVDDPFAEVAVLDLPDGGACVLQPRALVAVTHAAGRPLRITSHWRLGSLHAWLTLQLRYLMFHGPARLVVRGGRGVRVERAERGRIFGQSQLVGFSADLAYAIARTETFWPYFLGRESLLKDRVEAGAGVLIVEEAPTAGGRGAPRKGLEGAADIVLKAFGIQ